MRVLLVEDHARLALTVAAGLGRLGMAVDVAFDGSEALAKTTVTVPTRQTGHPMRPTPVSPRCW